MIPKDIIEKIREKNDIVEVISEYVNLQKVGSNYRGLCPFHLETTPSFYVSPQKGIYHCFGCGASGDVIKFVQEIENISYVEAVRKLGERVGIAVSYTQEDEIRNKYYTFYKELHQLYKSKLNQSTVAFEYLKKRGFDAREISLYEFGFSPSDSKLPQQVAQKLRLSKDEIEKFGFSNTDPFAGRLIIPITDDFGRVIAFGGRLIGEGVPKYLNSQDTLLFKKSSTFYMLSFAKEHIKEVDYVIICEGYFDALAFHRAGIKNAVATLGTALTKLHIYKLKKLTTNIVLAYDSDSAGIKAALRSLEMLIPEGFNVVIASFEEAKDADETYSKFGTKGLVKVLDSSVGAEQFVVESLAKQYDLSNPSGFNTFVKVLKNWERIFSTNPKSIEKFYEHAAATAGVTKEELKNLLSSQSIQTPNQQQRYPQNQNVQLPKTPVKKVPTTEDYLVYMYFNYPELFKQIEFTPDLLEGKAREFFLIAKDLNVSLDSLSKYMGDFVKEVFDKIDFEVDDKVVEYIKKDLELRRIDKRIAEIDSLVLKATSEDEKRILLKARTELVRQKMRIKNQK
ncbi:DNA primase [Fervidobacterium changbaicum]|uniref:DNA primase n=1 Tax=Fervidobacterium changbaicum TaxID=310769 RepID=A0ABX5QUT7_9BACT|nr:DNA primase [Fervidobacterium changbaicum]QAV34221.1 DNA primase [Fervidobacterium changbaicum]SDH31750.1 DNA primase [Fervidobacterium changbaicum]